MQALRDLREWLIRQPFIGPLLKLAYSRKAMIAVFLTGLIMRYLPGLKTVETEVQIVVAQLVLITLIWLITSLGYALEDMAEKRNIAVASVSLPTATSSPGSTTATVTVDASPKAEPSSHLPV